MTATPDCVDWLADLMIPADITRGMPIGSAVGLRDLAQSEGKEEELLECALRVENSAQTQLGQSLKDMSDNEFQQLLKVSRSEIEPSIRIFGAELLKAYYTHPDVRNAVGIGSRPPFPHGFSVYAGNLELLEPVFERGPIFRNVSSEH